MCGSMEVWKFTFSNLQIFKFQISNDELTYYQARKRLDT
jgi:hypothetical protein